MRRLRYIKHGNDVYLNDKGVEVINVSKRKFRCKKCGFEEDYDEMMFLALMELAGAVISKRYKYCNWGEVDDDDELIEHEFEIIEYD